MLDLQMEGPWPLTPKAIDRVITRKSPGNFALGKTMHGGFIVHYLGRSSVDLNAELKKHVGKHEQFKASFAASAKRAFERDCVLWHFVSPSENPHHPSRPNRSRWTCPCCSAFD
jgi:hypothetical protein